MTEKYNQVINYLKEKIPQKEIDWVNINSTQEEPKESVYDYYERLMEAFRLHSGLQDVKKGHMANFVSHFILGLRSELCMNIQQNVICWQTKLLDKIL